MNENPRLHALDAVRGAALLLGIVLHATMSFFFFVPAQDRSSSVALAVTFYVIHMFRVSMFFVIAGFFAHMVLDRRGVRAFVTDRATRILVPLTVGWMILAPPTIAATIWGLTRTFPEGPPPGTEATAMAQQGFPLIHLWFLYYLVLFYGLALALHCSFDVVFGPASRILAGVDRAVRWGIRTSIAPVLLAAPLAIVLFADSTWLLWFGIPTPDVGLTPKVPAMIGYGTAFGLGWLLHRQTALFDVWKRRWWVHLVIASGLTALCLSLIGPVPTLSTSLLAEQAWWRFAYAAAYTVSIWYWTFGLIGMALRFCSDASPTRRYLADSSYWLYLTHLPLVFVLQVLLMDLPWHWSIKFPIILAVTLVVLLSSYHYLVRSTVVGMILNGRKYPRGHRGSSRVPPAVAIPGTAAVDTSVATLRDVSKRFGATVALDRLSLDVAAGELLAVLGPNGAGKSTAISLWLGLLQPDDGEVRLLGRSPLDLVGRLHVGVMLQEVDLAPELTARELIEQTASYYPNPYSVDDVLELTGMTVLANKRYGRMSGGQKRQTQFATAICGRPRLLFLDEPTVGLDVQARQSMWQVIRGLIDEGCSMVLTTHYLEEAEALAHRVAVLANGRRIAMGSVDEIRSLVTRKQIRCACHIELNDIKSWPGVVDAVREARVVQITAHDAESVVRRLLAADSALSQLEVKHATLAEAFTELTKEAA